MDERLAMLAGDGFGAEAIPRPHRQPRKVIVHNLMGLFKRMVLPAGWARKSLKTVRAYVLKVPGVLRRVGKGVALALPAAFPLQALVNEAAGRLVGLALGGSG